MSINGKLCTQGVWDESVPGIEFDNSGESNYSKIFKKMLQDYPRGDIGKKQWEKFINEIKIKGKGKPYDCIIGVSGGTDSSYLIHITKEYGLRPLAVYLDNGWASNISVSNIKKVLEPNKIDLVTHVIKYEEVKDVLKAYLKAGLPWADSPTDLAIKAILFKMAHKYNLKHVLIGHDFRSEGFQPTEWTYSDEKQMKYLTKTFSKRKLVSFPALNIFSFVYYSFFKGIKYVKPFFYIDYSKKNAKQLLKEQYDWEDYGGHHYENIFTKFIISYWLYEKFQIDKRKITFSAQILSGEIDRQFAIKELNKDPYKKEQIKLDIDYIIKKLDLTLEEFNQIFSKSNKSFNDYPSYYPFYKKFKKIIYFLIKYLLPNKPLMFYQLDTRKK